MMREEGMVVALEGDHAIVASARKSACGSCGSKSSCASLAVSPGGTETRIRAVNQAGARVGDMVVVSVTEKQFLRASFLVYLMPLVVFFAVGYLTQELMSAWGVSKSSSDLVSGLMGLLGVAGTFVGLRYYNTRIENDRRFQPVITQVRGAMSVEESAIHFVQ